MKFNFKKLVNNIYVKNLFLMAVLLVIIIFAILLWLNSYTRHNQSITVPSLKGLQVDEAKAILHSAKLNCEVVDSIYEKRGVPGSILEQIPIENSKVKEGRIVYFIVQARSEQLVTIPDLEDYSQRQAEALLNALGFNSIQIVEVPSEYKGIVMSVKYKGVTVSAGQKIPKGSALSMEVGSGGIVSSDSDSLYNEEEDIVE